MGEVFKQFSVQTIGRPEGYEYPTGLTPFLETTGITTTNVAASTTGGDQAVDTVNNFTTHTYTSSGTFDPSFSGTVQYLVVGGGGSGGAGGSGGGAGEENVLRD